MFVFGTQYLRGFTPARDQWRRDFDSMQAMGINTVRGWLVWNAIELRPGEIDEAYLHAFLDCARETGIGVGLLFHLHAAPEWAIRRHPDMYYVDAHGHPFEPAPRLNTPSGGWPGLCFDHDAVRDLEAAFIDQVLDSIGGRSEIVFWEPMNEPHVWVELEQNPVGTFCYCDATRTKFRRWLAAKYGDIRALNDAWGRHHNDFGEVRPPTWRMAYTDQCDFRTFHMENIAEEVAWRAARIRARDSRPVIAHAWGGGAVTCANLGAMAFDDWKNAQPVDLWGYSAFPADNRSNSVLGLGTDATRCAAQGKVIWQSELGAGDLGAGLNRGGRVSPETLASWTWESIRHGAKGMLYWQYRKERHGREHGTPALTDYDGGPTDNSRAVARIAKAIRDNDTLFDAAAVEPARVALLFSVQSYLVDWCDNRDCTLSIESMSGYYRIFWEKNIPVDIIHEDFTDGDALGRYRLLILPTPWALTERARAAVRAYVQCGGMLLCEPYPCAFTPDKQLDYRVPGGGFDAVFGAQELDIFSARGQAVPVVLDGRPLTLRNGHFRQTFRDVAGDVLATYGDGTPMIVQNRYGQGCAILTGVNLGLEYAPRVAISEHLTGRDHAAAQRDIRDWVLALARDAGVRPSVVTGDDRVQASLLACAGEPDDLLIVISTDPAPKRLTLQLPDAYTGYASLLGGGTGSVAGGVLALTLGAEQSDALRLRKREEATGA